ncbi:Nucleoside diphosphate kinase [Hondaea fermentalgiana]|uniref:Nucleoside diphosphate kinase n=1 Tax=Hondaea fermentalgiana TaxID=2315210 RepID=A0A2R5GFN5_9STRA|nr:Nucleoside diphosphate kinase [Hondaea fermentalgiana]|eukprot:GBG29395.1 Nucleoside diphosphate kinase [Hondaea fermentalgiana]
MRKGTFPASASFGVAGFGGALGTKDALGSMHAEPATGMHGLNVVVYGFTQHHSGVACHLIKPDGVLRNLTAEVINRFTRKGFKLVGLKMVTPSKEHLEKHYADLSSKGFFASLIEYMQSGPVVAMVWEGDNAVKTGRVMLGATHPKDSAPGTLRADFAIDIGRNCFHGSDSVESAKAEIALWFPEGVNSYKHPLEGLIYE